jgi:hypothetical protein
VTVTPPTAGDHPLAGHHAKFLAAGGWGRFSRFPWRDHIGTWVDAATIEPCVRGIHACRGRDLPFWLDDELWTIELDGPVDVADTKVVAARARVASPVSAWADGLAAALATACVLRIAGHAAEELRDAGISQVADELTAAIASVGEAGAGDEPTGSNDVLTQLAGVARAAATAADAATARGRRQAMNLCRYVGDATDTAGGVGEQPSVAAGVAYIAARAAYQRRDGALAGDPYAAERRWQADWLVARLPVTLNP